MPAASLTGLPQWYLARGPVILQAVTSSFAETSYIASGLDQSPLTGSIFGEVVASHIVTAGPTTTGPVIVNQNGVVLATGFNQSTKMPDWAFQIIANASPAGWLIT